jgi:hypothetical protein
MPGEEQRSGVVASRSRYHGCMDRDPPTPDANDTFVDGIEDDDIEKRIGSTMSSLFAVGTAIGAIVVLVMLRKML